jgi:hypothetical protein
MKKNGVDISEPGCLWKRNPLNLPNELKKLFLSKILVCSFCGFAWILKEEKSIADARRKLKDHAKI